MHPVNTEAPSTSQATLVSKEKPLISVLVRSLNRLELKRTLESVVQQGYRPLEVVVVAASEQTFDLPEMDHGDIGMRVVHRGKPLGMAAAANVALDEALGEFLIFLDDDDYFLPTHIEGLHAALVTDPEAVLAYSGVRLENNAGEFTGLLPQPTHYSPLPLHKYNFISNHAALFLRRFALECRFDELLPLYTDWDFWLQVAARGRFVGATQNITCCYRVESGVSGAGAGANVNHEKRRFAHAHIMQKHASQRLQLETSLGEIATQLDAAWQQNDWTRARALCAQSIGLNSDQPDVLNRWALIAVKMQEWPLALRLLRAALLLKPQDATLIANLAQVYVSTNELQHARVYAHLASLLQPDAGAIVALAKRLGIKQ